MPGGRAQGVLLVGSLVVATVAVLAMVLAWSLDHQHCQLGFPALISCSYTW